MKITSELLEQAYQRVLNQEAVTDIAVELGLLPATLSKNLIEYTKATNKHDLYHQAIHHRLVNTYAKEIAVSFTNEQGITKTYPSLSKACRDAGISYHKLKQLLKENKAWKLA